MTAAKLYVLQRFSAMLLAPLVLVHLVGIVLAVRGGLSADEILSRTQGSVGWALFYGLFVLLAAVHGAIGLRAILVEWARLPRWRADVVAFAWLAAAIVLGARAVVAVTA